MLPRGNPGAKKEVSRPFMLYPFSAKSNDQNLYSNPPRFNNVASFSNLMTSRQKKAPGGPGFKEIGYEKNLMRRFTTTTTQKPSWQKYPSALHSTRKYMAKVVKDDNAAHPKPEKKTPTGFLQIPHARSRSPAYYYKTYNPTLPHLRLTNNDIIELLKKDEVQMLNPGGPKRPKKPETFEEFHARMNTRPDGTFLDTRSFISRFKEIQESETPPHFPPPPWVTLTKEEQAKVDEEKKVVREVHALNLKKRLDLALNPPKAKPIKQEQKIQVLFPIGKKWKPKIPKLSIKTNGGVRIGSAKVKKQVGSAKKRVGSVKNRVASAKKKNRSASPKKILHPKSILKKETEMDFIMRPRPSAPPTPTGRVQLNGIEGPRTSVVKPPLEPFLSDPPSKLVHKPQFGALSFLGPRKVMETQGKGQILAARTTKMDRLQAPDADLRDFKVTDFLDPYAPKHPDRREKYTYKYDKFH